VWGQRPAGNGCRPLRLQEVARRAGTGEADGTCERDWSWGLKVKDLIELLQRVDQEFVVVGSWEDEHIQYGVSFYDEAISLQLGSYYRLDSGPYGSLGYFDQNATPPNAVMLKCFEDR
jgi:hypothetical protein